jgi:predicted permease
MIWLLLTPVILIYILGYGLCKTAALRDEQWKDYFALIEDGREDQAYHYFEDVLM